MPVAVPRPNCPLGLATQMRAIQAPVPSDWFIPWASSGSSCKFLFCSNGAEAVCVAYREDRSLTCRQSHSSLVLLSATFLPYVLVNLTLFYFTQILPPLIRAKCHESGEHNSFYLLPNEVSFYNLSLVMFNHLSGVPSTYNKYKLPIKMFFSRPFANHVNIFGKTVLFLIAEIIFSQFRDAFIGMSFPKLGSLFLVFQKKKQNKTIKEIASPDAFLFSERTAIYHFWFLLGKHVSAENMEFCFTLGV